MAAVVSVFKQTSIMMLLWMDVTHTSRRARSRGLSEDNGRELGSGEGVQKRRKVQ